MIEKVVAELRLRRVVVVLIVSTAIACSGRPMTAPSSGTPSLAVRIIDDVTGQLVTDSDYGIVVNLTGDSSYTSKALDGTVSFSGLTSGVYRVTTEIEYGYRQLDLLNVIVDGPRTLDLRLLPIDDLTVREIFVEGQGSIARGGVVEVPPSGVNVHFRGKRHLVKYPSPQAVGAYADFNFGSVKSFDVGASSATEWESILNGYYPCHGSCTGPPPVVQFVHLVLSRYVNLAYQEDLLVRNQQWPLTFRLVP